MAEDATAVIDGKKVYLYSYTGKVLSSKKDKETVISSQTMGTGNNRQTAVSSTTVDHHEIFMVDANGKERSVQLQDFDFPLREGNTLSLVWLIKEGDERGPYIHARNHSTDEVNQIYENNIADSFRKPWWMILAVAAALGFATMFILGPFAMFMILVSFFYFRRRSRKAVKAFLKGPEIAKIDAELAKIPAM
jgi:hypothetical protein